MRAKASLEHRAKELRSKLESVRAHMLKSKSAADIDHDLMDNLERLLALHQRELTAVESELAKRT